MPSANAPVSKTIAAFAPLWFYIVLYKFGAGIHFAMIAILGARVLPLWIVGLSVAYASLLKLALDVPAGFFLERYGYLRLLRLTTLLFIGAGGVLLFELTPLTFFLTITLGALGWLFFTPGINAYLLSHGPAPIIGKLFGILRASEGAGVMLALIGLPLFVQLSTPALGLIILFPLIGSLGALAIGRRFRMPSTLPEVLSSKIQIQRAGYKKIRTAFAHLHPVGTALGVHMLCVASFYGIIWFVFTLIIEEGTAKGVLSASMAALEFATIISGLTIARFVDSGKKKSLIIIGLAGLATTTAFLGTTLAPLLILICLLFSFSDELVRITLWAWIDERAPEEQHHAIVTGVISFLEDLGWAIGPAIAGIFLASSGAPAVLRLGSLIILIGVLIILWLMRYAEVAKTSD